jgi:L-alanine-DL-glutamate epimerase-like enolase superfamily enzyme
MVGGDAADTAVWLEARLQNAPGARGALETALADARARAAGLPLYRFLGAPDGTTPERATDLSLPILPPDEAAVRARQAVEQGFRAVKLKVGSDDPAADLARVRWVAEAAPNARLLLDGNQGFTADTALRFAASLGDDLAARVTLFEQPTPAGDDDALRRVAASAPFPVYADEAVRSPEDAARLVGSGACAGVVLKLAKTGLSQTRAVARAVCDAGGVCLFGCMMETRVGIGAALHLALALGKTLVPHLDLDGDLLVDDASLVTGGPARDGDRLRVRADVPGLGVSTESPCS